MRLACVLLLVLVVLPACSELAGTAPLNGDVAAKRLGVQEKTCRAVRAVATGFGERNVTGLADGNLDLAIDAAKDQMASEGAKGFTVQARAVRCEGYIDFGGAIGREHKCHASAQLCGKIG